MNCLPFDQLKTAIIEALQANRNHLIALNTTTFTRNTLEGTRQSTRARPFFYLQAEVSKVRIFICLNKRIFIKHIQGGNFMSVLDTDIDDNDSSEVVTDDDMTPSQQRVATRRRLEDFLQMRRLRDEVNYMVDSLSYDDSELCAYGLGEGSDI